MALFSGAACTEPRPAVGSSMPAPIIADAPLVVTVAPPALDPAPPAASDDIARLREAIASYRQLAAGGDWPSVTARSKLEMGATGDAVRSLRARLHASGDLVAAADGDVFDADLAAALRRFQQRHGLLVDGILGPKSLAALNVPVTQRLATIEINLRRIRQQHRDWGERYLESRVAVMQFTNHGLGGLHHRYARV
jgi:murein L,D-transpeptidase YcbB/YkuD